jgi:methionyl-tRNA formyltransferase
LRVVFAGTPPFAARALQAILAAGHEVVVALTQPDRPAGRGLHVNPSAVAQAAASHGVATLKPQSLKQGDAASRLRELAPDVMVVAAYGLILPQAVLEIPRRGCLNIHASLLPRWRGAAPIQRALQAGDEETGICIMLMDAGLDTGPVLLEKRLAIGARETAATLTESLAQLGAQAVVEALASLDTLQARAQDPSRATYAAKITKADARIDWSRPATEIDRQVRAFNPIPGAETRLDAEPLKIWEAEPAHGSGAPGEVLESESGRLLVACGAGALALRRMQRPGGKALSSADFLRGTRIARGTLLESAPSAA